MTPLSWKNYIRQCNLQHLKRFCCEDYENDFARYESDCTLRFGFKAQMKRILCTKQSNLSLHF